MIGKARALVQNVVSSSKLTDSEPSCDKTIKKVWFLIGAFRVSWFPQAWLTNSSWKNYDGPKNKTGSLSHHLPDALCQQVRALIGLTLPNCAVINEWLCSVPSSRLILLYLFGFGLEAAGPNVNVWHFPVSLFSFGCVSDVPRGDLRGGCTAGSRGATAGRPCRVRVVDCTNVSGEGAQNVTFAFYFL